MIFYNKMDEEALFHPSVRARANVSLALNWLSAIVLCDNGTEVNILPYGPYILVGRSVYFYILSELAAAKNGT